MCGMFRLAGAQEFLLGELRDIKPCDAPALDPRETAGLEPLVGCAELERD